MADGSGRPTVERRARQAAADAASDARAEVLTEARAAEPPASKIDERSRRQSSGDANWHRFLVDVWITNFNDVEFGIYKHSRNKAKSRQFTSDMDIFAEIIENGERTGLIGYREDLWRKATGMDKRLVFKLFGERLNWHATMDLMIGRSLQHTIGARGLPVTCYSLNVGDHDHMVYLERSANKWPFLPENHSFFLIVDGKPQFYRLKRNLIDLGGDYALIDQRGETIGHIDGRLLSIGGKWNGQVRKDRADKRLLMVLKLFCGMLGFNRGAKRHVRRLARDVMAGKYEPHLEKQEADLYMNPRRVR